MTDLPDDVREELEEALQCLYTGEQRAVDEPWFVLPIEYRNARKRLERVLKRPDELGEAIDEP